ncbi:Zf-C2HC5 domain-containing protein [Aphelenchoides fujianensis]|nr:Zf-C2HC5 domain-containing protein [Aphelenchoides fujianensis]
MRIAGHIPNRLPGRHRCECQARIHALVRNCTSCGRIVCEQEGSGPCIFCGEFVCTREEAEIIRNDPKKGAELHRQLLKASGYATDMSRRKQEEEAQKYRDQLLRADRESVARTKVFDLDSDYYNVETSHYLTGEEREAIRKRKDDLRHQRQSRATQALQFNWDLTTGTVEDTSRSVQIETAEDPIITGILAAAERRRERQLQSAFAYRQLDLPTAAGFKPKYDEQEARSSIPAADEFDFSHAAVDQEQLWAEVERKGFFLAVHQPAASRIVVGKQWYLPFDQHVDVQGPVFVAATNVKQKSASGMPELSLVGKVLLADCITMGEFLEENPDTREQSDAPFVLLFEKPVVFDAPFPYVAETPFGRLPKAVRDVVKNL